MRKEINTMLMLGNLGFKPKEMFRDMGIKNMYVYCNQEYDVPISETKIMPILSSFFHDDFTPNVNVTYISNSIDRPQVFIDRHAFNVIKFLDSGITPLCEDDFVLVLSNDTNLSIIKRIQDVGCRYMGFAEFSTLALSYLLHYRAVIELQRKANITAIFINRSVPPKHLKESPNFSENEKFILNKGFSGLIHRFLKAVNKAKTPSAIGTGFEGYNYNTVEGLNQILTIPQSTNTAFGTVQYENVSSEFVNYEDGRRVTTNQPKHGKRNIFTVGPCDIAGIGQPDSGTFSSNLQKLLNENAENCGFVVHNYGMFRLNRHILSHTTTLNLPVQDDDIVIIWLDRRMAGGSGVFEKFCTENWKYLDYKTLFVRPHDYGEVYFDNFHTNERGTAVYAQKIFDVIKDNDYFQTQIETKINSFIFGGGVNIGAEFAEWSSSIIKHRLPIGAIVMNCNPFTLGHRYLIEYAASRVTHLYIFAVEEDKSVFTFKDRFELMKKGTADLPNVTVLPSGNFIISSLTFVDYFNKAEIQEKTIDPTQDVEIFAKHIAPILGINIRFAGEEPLDLVTRQYNETMQRILPKHGVQFVEIPRKDFNGEVISASRVRKLLDEKLFGEIGKIVPKTTLEFLVANFGN